MTKDVASGEVSKPYYLRKSYRIVLKFDRRLGSLAVDAPATFQYHLVISSRGIASSWKSTILYVVELYTDSRIVLPVEHHTTQICTPFMIWHWYLIVFNVLCRKMYIKLHDH